MADERYLWQKSGANNALDGLEKSGSTYYVGAASGVFGKTSSSAIAFYGGTPATRPSAPSAVATTVAVSSVSTSTWAFSTSTQANAIVTAVNTLIGIVTSLGLAS